MYLSCFFVSEITRKRLGRFAWNFLGKYGVTMGWPDYIFGQFWESARCRDAQHGDGVCCAFAPQLVFYSVRFTITLSCCITGTLFCITFYLANPLFLQWNKIKSRNRRRVGYYWLYASAVSSIFCFTVTYFALLTSNLVSPSLSHNDDILI